MGERLRLNGRMALAALFALALVFGVAGRGGAASGDPVAVISIGNAAPIVEGGTAVFPITVSPQAPIAFTVDYTSSAGDSGTISIPEGDQANPPASLALPVADDGKPNGDRTLTVTLSNIVPSDPSADPTTVATIGTATATATVIDNEPAAVISIGNAASITEGGTAVFPITVSPRAPIAFTVDYTSSAGGSGTISIPEGDQANPPASLSLPVADDGQPNGDRTLTVTLSNIVPSDPSADPTKVATIGTATATATVIDNDWHVSAAAVPSSAGENGGTIDFQVSLNAPASSNHGPISVAYSVNSGTAQLNTDYTITQPAGQASGTLTFAPGVQTMHVTIQGHDDGVYGSDKQLSFALSAPQNASISGPSSIPATITEADTPPVLGISDCSGGGTVTAGGLASFPVRMHPTSSIATTVHYTTGDDTTVAGDYDSISGDLTIPAQQTEFDLKVQTHATGPAGDHQFHVQLSSPSGATILTGLAHCTIHNTTGGTGGNPALSTISVANPSPAVEPATGSPPVNVTVTVTVTPPASQTGTPAPVNVAWMTKDGSAVAGTDYTAANGTLTWAAGASGPKTFTVKVLANPDPGTSPTSFSISFSSPDSSGTFVGATSATVTILPQGSTTSVLSIADASAAEHAGTIPVDVTLTPAAAAPVTVDYTTFDGQGGTGAIAGQDYTTTSGTLTFAPGATKQTISVPITKYSSVEPSKTFGVQLKNPVGATLSNDTATLTILNDNALPSPIPAANSGTKLKKPIAVPAPQPKANTTGVAHIVVVSMITGHTQVDAKGRATFRINCPTLAVARCTGSLVLQVRVQPKTPKGAKKKPALKTVLVASGAFNLPRGRTADIQVKLTKAGLALVQSLKIMRVKATLTSKDGAGSKGVSAWIVSVQAPAGKQIVVKTR